MRYAAGTNGGSIRRGAGVGAGSVWGIARRRGEQIAAVLGAAAGGEQITAGGSRSAQLLPPQAVWLRHFAYQPLTPAAESASVPASAFAYTQVRSAYALSLKAGIWERPMALLGIWGNLIEQVCNQVYTATMFKIGRPFYSP